MRLKFQPTGLIRNEKTEVKAMTRKNKAAVKRPAPHFLPSCATVTVGAGKRLKVGVTTSSYVTAGAPRSGYSALSDQLSDGRP